MPISKIRLPSKPPADYEVPHGGEGGCLVGDLMIYLVYNLHFGCVFLVILYGLYHGIQHHQTDHLGEYILYFFLASYVNPSIWMIFMVHVGKYTI